MNYRFLSATAVIALAVGLAAVAPVQAQTPAAPADQTPAPAPPPHPMVGDFMFSGHTDAGTNVNVDSPANNINYGQTSSDRANSFRVYQTELAVEKDLDPAATGLDWGFKLQGLYGTDARYTHTVGLADRATSSPYQFAPMAAYGQAHLPVIVSGGIDMTVGLSPTPIGYEVVDATGNFFLTHSYIYQFANPVTQTGIMTTSHVNSLVDVWLGVDTGVNEGLPIRAETYNKGGGFLGGIGINNPIPNLTILGLFHASAGNGYQTGLTPVNPAVAGSGTLRPDRNKYDREFYDLVTNYKVSDALSVANESTVIHDDLVHASGEGTAFYGVYKFTDQWSFGARAEVFRDDQGFFVAAFTESLAPDNAQRGISTANPAFSSGYSPGKATYGALTLGANYVPPIPPLPLGASLTIRPEVRYDQTWGMNPHAKAFDVNSSGVGTKDNQFLFSVDAVFGF
jgi:hypothetical protein